MSHVPHSSSNDEVCMQRNNGVGSCMGFEILTVVKIQTVILWTVNCEISSVVVIVLKKPAASIFRDRCKAVGSSEMLETIYGTTWCYIQKDHSLNRLVVGYQSVVRMQMQIYVMQSFCVVYTCLFISQDWQFIIHCMKFIFLSHKSLILLYQESILF